MAGSHFTGPVYSQKGFYGPTYTYATLPAASSVNPGTSYWTTDQGWYTSNGVSWVAAATGFKSPIQSRPIMGLIAHSFGVNTINKSEIISVSVTDTAGTVSLTTASSLGLSVSGNVLRVLGLGAKYDGIWTTATVSEGGPVVYTYTSANAVGSIISAFTPPLASAYAYSGSGTTGVQAGYIGAGGLAWAMTLLKRSFVIPPSYCYVFSGGNIVSLGSPDPGLATSITQMLSKNPLPQYVYIDLGVNDFNSGQVTLAQVQSAIATNIPRLTAAGIVPVLMAIRSTGLTLTLNKQLKRYNKWLSDYCRTIGAIFVDSNYTMTDVAGANASVGGNLQTCMYFGQAGTAYVHVNCLGAKRDGIAIKDVLSGVFPPGKTPVVSVSDAYDSTYNPTGCIAPLISGAVPGLFTAVVSDTTLTGTPALINSVYAFVSGAGTSAVTAGVRASTATTSDGALLPGYELVLKFGAGTGPRYAWIQFASGAGNFSSNYSAGDIVQMEAEVVIPSTGVTTSVSYAMPSMYIQENAQWSVGQYNNQYTGCFSNNTSSNDVAAVITAGAATDVAFDGVIATPVLQTRSGTNYLIPIFQTGIYNGTLGAGPYTVIIRSLTIRKVDPVYGEPF